MRVLLAGATGVVGTELVARLLAAGHEVLALTRSPGRLAGVTPVVADLTDRDAVLAAVEGHEADAVVHQATAISGVPLFHRHLYATDALREHGTATLVEAARRMGARRFVTQSFFLGYGYHDHGPDPVTEDHPFARPGTGPFEVHMRAMRRNERLALETPGIEGVALRYGMFYGPEPATRRLMHLARRRLLPVFRPSGLITPVHVHDAASAAVAALERGQGAYNIAGDEAVSFGVYVRALARAAGAPEPYTVPSWPLRAAPYAYAMLVRTRIRLSTEKAERELGWTPAYPTLRDGIRRLCPG
ncbi:NAD-dependent epimerase/dehydratase family protein [Nonomuraea terrae]|uniref:NAD-dependent epimerase/dehydratase family protein n=1 Tax=Nonomuraea terrae TaxID=2530383 RepID=UPI00378ED883